MRSRKFRTYANKNALIAIYGGIAILVVSIGGPLILTPKEQFEQFEWSWFYLFPIAIFSFFIYVMVASFLKLFISFKVSDAGLLIRKPLFHKRLIPVGEIREVILMDESQTYRLFENEVKSQYSFKDDSDISGYFHKIQKESPYYKYLTITPSGTSAGTDQAEEVTSVSIKAEMVLLVLKNEEKLFLSPKHVRAFYEFLRDLVKSS